ISFALATASRVLFEVAPAMMGTRAAAVSIVKSMTRSHSSWDRVGVSPVVPHGTRKSMPDSTCQRTSPRNATSSRLPSSLKGVTKAVPHPRSFMQPRIIQKRDSPQRHREVSSSLCLCGERSASELRENILEVVEPSPAGDPFGCQHCSLGESAAGLDFVGEHDTIAGRDQLQRVNAGNIAFALGSDLDALSRRLLQQPL